MEQIALVPNIRPAISAIVALPKIGRMPINQVICVVESLKTAMVDSTRIQMKRLLIVS